MIAQSQAGCNQITKRRAVVVASAASDDCKIRQPFPHQGNGANEESIPVQPEELLRGGEEIGVTTRRGGNVGEGNGEGGRGLQTEASVGPAQRELIAPQFRIKARGRDARRISRDHGPSNPLKTFHLRYPTQLN